MKQKRHSFLTLHKDKWIHSHIILFTSIQIFLTCVLGSGREWVIDELHLNHALLEMWTKFLPSSKHTYSPHFLLSLSCMLIQSWQKLLQRNIFHKTIWNTYKWMKYQGNFSKSVYHLLCLLVERSHKKNNHRLWSSEESFDAHWTVERLNTISYFVPFTMTFIEGAISVFIFENEINHEL